MSSKSNTSKNGSNTGKADIKVMKLGKKPADNAAMDAMIEEMNKLKASLLAANAEKAALEAAVEAAKSTKKQNKPAISAFVSVLHALIAGNGKGYVSNESLEAAIEAVKPLNTAKESGESLFNSAISRIKHNIYSNIDKQADAKRGTASIGEYIALLTLINKVLNTVQAANIAVQKDELTAKLGKAAK